MRYRYLAVCSLLFLLLLTGCGGVESPTPDGSPSSVETGAPAQTTREPVEIVLQGVDAPGMALDVAGFEDSLWGDSIEEILEGEDLSGWTLVNEHTTFGGVNCKAYYTFRDGGLAGGYYSIKFGEYGPEGFRAVLDYLTELYGEPGFLFDGEGEAVSDPNEGFADGLGQVSWFGSSSERLKADTIVTLWGLEDGVVNVAFVESGSHESQE